MVLDREVRINHLSVKTLTVTEVENRRKICLQSVFPSYILHGFHSEFPEKVRLQRKFWEFIACPV